MPFYYAKVTVDKKTDKPKINKQKIDMSKSVGKRKFNQICWDITANEDDIFVIYIDGDVFDEKKGPFNSYSTRIKKSGKGQIKTKKLRDKATEKDYKYIIVRVFGAYHTNVKCLDPQISVRK